MQYPILVVAHFVNRPVLALSGIAIRLAILVAPLLLLAL